MAANELAARSGRGPAALVDRPALLATPLRRLLLADSRDHRLGTGDALRAAAGGCQLRAGHLHRRDDPVGDPVPGPGGPGRVGARGELVRERGQPDRLATAADRVPGRDDAGWAGQDDRLGDRDGDAGLAAVPLQPT